MASKAMVLGFVAFTFCAWAVQLGGLAALNVSCNNGPEDISNYLATRPSAAAAQASAFFADLAGYYDAVNYGYVPACSQAFSFQWWIVVAEFLLISTAVIVFSPHDLMYRSKTAVIGCLAVLTTLNWLYAARYSMHVWRLSSVLDHTNTVASRVICTYVGYILVGVGNVFWMFALSMFRRAEPHHGAGKSVDVNIA